MEERRENTKRKDAQEIKCNSMSLEQDLQKVTSEVADLIRRYKANPNKELLDEIQSIQTSIDALTNMKAEVFETLAAANVLRQMKSGSRRRRTRRR